MTKKRRESGRKYNKNYDPEHGEYYEQYWDDWNDRRDSYRDIGGDGTQFVPENLPIRKRYMVNMKHKFNRKLKRLLRRRLRMKTKRPK